jgi:hypothetical protein
MHAELTLVSTAARPRLLPVGCSLHRAVMALRTSAFSVPERSDGASRRAAPDRRLRGADLYGYLRTGLRITAVLARCWATTPSSRVRLRSPVRCFGSSAAAERCGRLRGPARTTTTGGYPRIGVVSASQAARGDGICPKRATLADAVRGTRHVRSRDRPDTTHPGWFIRRSGVRSVASDTTVMVRGR